MNQRHRGTAAAAAVFILLAACGGESSPPDSATAARAEAPVDTRVTLSAYSADRAASAPETAAPEALLSAALALALPTLQSNVGTTPDGDLRADRAIVLPALQAARIDVLRAAAAGATRAELEAALPAAASVAATRPLLQGVSRQLWAPASSRFARDFLASTDIGGAAANQWQAIVVADWLAPTLALADHGPSSSLGLTANTRLVIGQRFEAHAPTNGQAVAFEGVGLGSPDRWYTAPMLALEGPGGTLLGDGFAATATWVGEHLWVALRPPGDAPLFAGIPPATLSAALQAVWAAYPAPAGVTSRSTQVWPQVTQDLPDRSRLPAGIALPYDEAQANLSGLDGGGTFLTETARAGSLAIAAAGLRVDGAQAMAFTFSSANEHGGGSTSSAGSIRTLFVFPPPCPRAVADWRGAILALIDRAGRLLLVATLPDAGSAATACRPI